MTTIPSSKTVAADRRDARRRHVPDRPPTAAEEAAAERLRVDPHVAESYRQAIVRGAHVRGEGRI